MLCVSVGEMGFSLMIHVNISLPEHLWINLAMMGRYHGTGGIDFSYLLKSLGHLLFGQKINFIK
jgi:hypothetical protein